MTAWRNETNRWRRPQPVNKRDRNGNDKVEIARAPCRYNISGRDKPVARPLPAPPPPPPAAEHCRRRPSVDHCCCACACAAPRTLTRFASSYRRFLARVMWISPEGSVRAYVWSFFQFVVNLLKFKFSDPCIIMIYTDKMFPEDFENHPTYYARRYVQAQPQEPPRSRVRSLKPLSNQVSFHYLICRGSTVNHIRTIGTF